MHFGGIGHGVVGLVGLLGGGAEDGDGAVRHEDVAVGRLAQPVDHAAGEAVVEGNQRPAVGLDVDVQPRGMGQLAHPAPGGVDHEAAGDFPGLPGAGVAHAYARDLSVGAVDGGDFRIGTEARAMPDGVLDVLQTRRKPSTAESGTRYTDTMLPARLGSSARASFTVSGVASIPHLSQAVTT